MEIKDFIELTNFKPTKEYFVEYIYPQFKDSGLDKESFCKQWLQNGGIQKAYDRMCAEVKIYEDWLYKLENKLKNFEEYYIISKM